MIRLPQTRRPHSARFCLARVPGPIKLAALAAITLVAAALGAFGIVLQITALSLVLAALLAVVALFASDGAF
ncbi:hypothetical protein AADZ90_004380 [Aestuariibius sp. 2305UL40-4]|uniref:hypothetical protein n=1 Tax=Aestuariibius violaceus TaxID=3234132 RepID=UPI00345E0968